MDLVGRLLKGARQRAKKTGVEYAITRRDVVIPQFCPVLEIPLFKGPNGGCSNSPTLDRLDPSQGYVPGNVAVISMRANRIKNDANVVELRRVADWIEMTAM